MRNPCLDGRLRRLEECGIRDIEQARGGKHPQLRFRINGGAALHVYSVPGTPSDWRSPTNTKAELRRYLREQGVITAPERPASPPPRQPSRVELLEQRIATLETRLAALERAVRA